MKKSWVRCSQLTPSYMPVGSQFVIANLRGKNKKKIEKCPSWVRTAYLCIRRPTPYPLRYESWLENSVKNTEYKQKILANGTFFFKKSRNLVCLRVFIVGWKNTNRLTIIWTFQVYLHICSIFRPVFISCQNKNCRPIASSPPHFHQWDIFEISLQNWFCRIFYKIYLKKQKSPL